MVFLIHRVAAVICSTQMLYRFLANGDTFRSTSYNFLVARTTVGKIIKETCEAIWGRLCKEFVTFPQSTADWIKVQKFNTALLFNTLKD